MNFILLYIRHFYLCLKNFNLTLGRLQFVELPSGDQDIPLQRRRLPLQDQRLVLLDGKFRFRRQLLIDEDVDPRQILAGEQQPLMNRLKVGIEDPDLLELGGQFRAQTFLEGHLLGDQTGAAGLF